MSPDREEWRGALLEGQPATDCANGCHALIRQTGGGGTCLVCGPTVERDEL